jgi:two-component sensor histidine kinase
MNANKDVILIEQIKSIYKTAPVAMIAPLVNSVFLAILLYGRVDLNALVAWTACNWILTGGRYVLISSFNRTRPDDRDIPKWGLYFNIGLFLAGVVFGSAGIVLFPTDSLALQTVLALFMGGMVAGAAGSYNMLFKTYLIYAVPVLTPLIIKNISLYDSLHVMVGLTGTIYLIIMTVTAWRMGTISQKSMGLKFENLELVRSLRDEVQVRLRAESKLKEAHNGLEALVAERTNELIKTNEKLGNEISEKKKAEGDIRKSLKEKEILLKEVHHRVKNNLAIISSLLSLQARYIDDKKYLELFKESQGRVRSMALVHEKLYQSDDFEHINVKDYIETLAKSISDAYLSGRGNINVNLDIEDLSIELDELIPCGLIINEVLANSFKHAFSETEDGQILITLRKSPDNMVRLEIMDNGKGLPEDFDIKGIDSLGLKIVNTLVVQLDAEMALEGRDGTRFSIIFPETITFSKEA